MKNISIVLNIILLIAIIILFILHFSDRESIRPVKNPVVSSDTSVSKPSKTDIAYIRIDSLLRGYEYYNVLEEKLKKKRSALEAQLERKQKAFMEEYNTFIEKAQRGTFLSQERQAEEELRLQKEQQDVMLYEQDITNELMEEGQKLEKQLYDTVINYLKVFNNEGNYRYIFDASVCLYKQEGMDMTDTIINALNARYREYLKVLGEDNN